MARVDVTGSSRSHSRRVALALTLATLLGAACSHATVPPVSTPGRSGSAAAGKPRTVESQPAPAHVSSTTAPAAPTAAQAAPATAPPTGTSATLAPAPTLWPGPYVEEPSAPRARAPLTILQINDVYSTVPVDGIGGLARVASLKRQLAQAGRTPLLVIAGDFLSPSVASSVFKGEQMVAALNAAGLDLAMIGNHEFDFGIDVLRQRMKESRFEWIVSNVADTSGQPLSGTVPYLVRTFG